MMQENRNCGCGCNMFGGDSCMWIIFILLIVCCCGGNSGRGCC